MKNPTPAASICLPLKRGACPPSSADHWGWLSLNNAFGIGIILMQANDSKILYPAREKALDYNTIEKLNNLNPDFCSFITKLSKVMNASRDYTADARNSFEKICDKVFESDEELENYCKNHNIPF